MTNLLSLRARLVGLYMKKQKKKQLFTLRNKADFSHTCNIGKTNRGIISVNYFAPIRTLQPVGSYATYCMTHIY